MQNKTRKKFDFSVTVLIVLGIIIVVNFFSYQIFARFDITQNRDYSISKISKKTAGELDDIVTIKAYFSKNLPSQYIAVRQEVADILDEYKNYSGGKINVEFIDPASDQKTEQELYMQGIPPLQFNVLEKDKYQVVKGYLGIAVSYSGKSEAIPVVQDTQNLEYQLTTAIKKVISKDAAKVGIVTSQKTLNVESEMSAAYKKLSELYTVETVDLATAKEIPVGIKTLLIIGPKEKFSDAQFKIINAFLMKGGNLIVAADSYTVGQNLTATPNESNISELLAKYGIKINKDLVEDTQSGMAAFNQGFITYSVNYPFWPKVQKSGFNQENAAVANLETAVFPWISSIELNQEKAGDAQVSVLAKSTGKAMAISENIDISPQSQNAPTAQKEQNFIVMLSGNLKSAYPNEKNLPKESASSRMIVVGDSDFIADNFIQNTPDNVVLFQNLTDILSLDEDLIGIRSKGVTSRPLPEFVEWEKAVIRYGNIFGMFLIVMIFGTVKYALRKRRSFAESI